MNPSEVDEARILVHRMLDSPLSETEIQRLNHLLRSSVEARGIYLELMSVHSELEQIFGNDPLASNYPTERAVLDVSERENIAWVRWTAWSTGVLVTLLGIAFLTLWTKGTFRYSEEDLGNTRFVRASFSNRHPIAMLLLDRDCLWGAGLKLKEGERIFPGDLHLKAGTAAIRLDSGAELIVKSPAELRIESPTLVKLSRGQVAVRAEFGANGFVLRTAACDVMDLGTEFAAKIAPTGATDLQVNSGQVAVSLQRNEDKQGIVDAGPAWRIERSGLTTPYEGDIDSFGRLLEQMIDSNPDVPPRVAEDFEYKLGDHSPESLKEGLGWRGPWRLREPNEMWPEGQKGNPRLLDDTTSMRIVEAAPWPHVEDERQSTKALEIPPGQSFRIRDLESPIEMGRNSVVYIGVVLQQLHNVKPGQQFVESSFTRFSLRSSQDYWGSSILFGLNSKNCPYINIEGSGSLSCLSTIPFSKHQFWIFKIASHSAEGDEVAFRVYTSDDLIDRIEPSDWHLRSRDFFVDSSLDTMVLTSLGPTGVRIHSIRFGTNWNSVLPSYLDQPKKSDSPDSPASSDQSQPKDQERLDSSDGGTR